MRSNLTYVTLQCLFKSGLRQSRPASVWGFGAFFERGIYILVKMYESIFFPLVWVFIYRPVIKFFFPVRTHPRLSWSIPWICWNQSWEAPICTCWLVGHPLDQLVNSAGFFDIPLSAKYILASSDVIHILHNKNTVFDHALVYIQTVGIIRGTACQIL